MRYNFSALFLILAISCTGKNEQTPFSNFAGREYGSYHYALRDTLRKVYATDDEGCVDKAVSQMLAMTDIRHDRQWQLEAEFLRLNFYHDYRDGDDEAFVDDLLSLKKKALAAGNRVFALRIIRRLMDHYIEISNPIDEIRYACMLERESEGITEEEFPDIIDNDYRLATLFLRYNSPTKAMPHLERVLKHEVIPEIELIFLDARNDLGIIARETDMNQSDSLFCSFLTDSTITDREYWSGLGECNLGTNAFIRKEYGKAVALLGEGFSIMEQRGEWALCSNVASEICRSYCHLGNLGKAGKWCDISKKYGRKAGRLESSFHQEMYSCISEYESMIGNYETANEYKDSCIAATAAPYSMWSPAIITDMEARIYKEELSAEERTSRVRLIVIFCSIFFSLVLAAAAIILYRLYKKCERLIMVLSQKAEIWTHEYNAYSHRGTGHIDRILEYLESSKSYLNKNCTLEDVARGTFLNRSYVSKAVNENYRNFNWMINSLRVREALKTLGKDSRTSVAELVESCGFGSTSSFYEAFRSVTGLTLKEYRKSLGKLPGCQISITTRSEDLKKR